MMGGQAAADTLLDMRSTGDFSKASTAVYQRRWMAQYGHDFGLSTKFAELIYRWVLRCFCVVVCKLHVVSGHWF